MEPARSDTDTRPGLRRSDGGPVELAGLSVAARYMPAGRPGRGGGGWHHAAVLPDGRALLAVGDVAGHGAAATAVAADLCRMLDALSTPNVTPGRLLAALNRLLYDRDVGTAGAAVGCYDPAVGTLTWAQAGHPAPLHAGPARGGDLDEARPAGMLLGADPAARYGEATLPLYPGDLLLMYAGGTWPDGRRGLARALRAARAGGPPLPAVLDGLPPAGPDDDACLLLARPAGTDGPPPAPSVPSGATELLSRGLDRDDLESTRLAVLGAAAAGGLNEIARHRFTVAVIEVATDAVRHRGARGQLRLWRDGERLLAWIADHRSGAPVTRPRRSRAEQRDGGRGLWLAREVCERVEIRSGSAGTTVLLSYAIAAPA